MSQNGITWTFDSPRETGQFVNGDWWVKIGATPLRIVNINPPSQNVSGRSINGSMLNPTSTQIQNCHHGYDSTLFGGFSADLAGNQRYEQSLNVAWGISPSSPLIVNTPSSLISTISSNRTDGFAIQTAAVLTILTTTPPSDAFRPAFSGTDKTVYHRLGQVNFAALGAYPAVGSPPSLSSVADSVQRVWLEHCQDWVNRHMHPLGNMPDYYRSFTTALGIAGLTINGSYSVSQKRPVAIGLIQIGIDWYRNAVMGQTGGVNGHLNMRKFPIMVAGKLLGDLNMEEIYQAFPTNFHAPGSFLNQIGFSEDGQTFFVEETSPGVYNWGYGGYTAAHVGMPEWGNFHAQNPASDSVVWELDYRRCCSANGWVGPALVIKMMGLEPKWGNLAFFPYMDRYMSIEQPGTWYRAWDPWTEAMWDTYRPLFP